MKYHIHITAEITADPTFQTLADLIANLSRGLGVHVLKVETSAAPEIVHTAVYRGPRKPRATARPTTNCTHAE